MGKGIGLIHYEPYVIISLNSRAIDAIINESLQGLKKIYEEHSHPILNFNE